ncbi:hypothetical protein J120_03250 [candidate division TM6 bacterium JCVI TM6SC1]|uniref:Large ribosomal subunit protein uL24 n=1 Tax=candidate division TM6 bacterium JCVI TM6SC1 TaxID=1306947 RepID=A0A0D2JE48_9BACT|nr:hypothetical protein J120_03250 [candidate division TM6 bacterium JCVI TM6SC1]
MVARVKKNDTVFILSGKDKGKTGMVIQVLPNKDKVLVQGIAVRTVHKKARKQSDVSGIKKEEGYIHLSRVMPLCTSCKKPCRTGVSVSDTGVKSRVCRRCQHAF